MNAYEVQVAYQLIYAGCEPEPGRFTNDLPINAEVWLSYRSSRFEEPRELLLTPHLAAGVAHLRQAVTKLLPELRPLPAKNLGLTPPGDDSPFIAANESHVLVRLNFLQLLRLLPLTSWWQDKISGPFLQRAATTTSSGKAASAALLARVADTLTGGLFPPWLAEEIQKHIINEQVLRQFKQIGVEAERLPAFADFDVKQREAVRRLVNVSSMYIALTLLDQTTAEELGRKATSQRIEKLCKEVFQVMRDNLNLPQTSREPSEHPTLATPLWAVALNRPATHAVASSRKTVKADAAIRVFDTGGHGIRWAIVDSGIDSTHPAFARLDQVNEVGQLKNQRIAPTLSRVVKTLDFTRFAAITSGRVSAEVLERMSSRLSRDEVLERVSEIESALANGQMLDWAKIEPLLEVLHDGAYKSPADTHGTHVAGVLGANWRSDTYKRLDPDGTKLPVPTELEDAPNVQGVCPYIELLDLRVFDSKRANGKSEGADEFAILAALQYVRYLNQSKDRQYVHGVNLSLSLRHDVRSYACGSTPVCLECERLVGSGVIVVAAAGNYGYDEDYGASHLGGAYRGQSITDPGNAPSVITVGSTHRSDPYQYGISYFSSHGPTGDGREKPDLVAPGEKIISTIPEGQLASKDGTSMAAPHVSGVAALLLSRNTELMGHPERVKEILCKSASDLGRGKVFQGYGLVDALRALQAV